jgi:hypothetical protein
LIAEAQLPGLLTVFLQETSQRVLRGNPAEMQIEIETMCGVLWALSNLQFESNLSRKLIEETKIYELDCLLLKAHFLENLVFE